MRKIYPFVILFILSAAVVFFVANVLVIKYEVRAKRELEKNVIFIINAIQSRIQTFLGVENDRELLSSIIREVMDENEDLTCIRIIDSAGKDYFKVSVDNSCVRFARLDGNSILDEENKWVIREKSGDIFVFYNTLYDVFGRKYHVFYVLRTHIFSPLYSLKLYFNLLALLFLFMEFLSFTVIVKVGEKLTKYRETLISFEQAVILDRLAGSLAHEIKNPLFVLSGNIELSDISEEDKNLLLSEIKRINGIIEKYESVFKKSQNTRCNPGKVLRDLEKLFAGQFSKKGLFMKVSCDVPFNLNIPEDQFKQVAINLVMNALQANASLRIDCIVLDDKRIKMRFCSRGKEIPQNIRKRMFEPYFTTRKEGTGLGLFVAKTIAEGYGGRLYYVYDNGENCFTLEVLRNEDSDS